MLYQISLPHGVVSELTGYEVCALCWLSINWSAQHQASAELVATEVGTRKKSRSGYYSRKVWEAETPLDLKLKSGAKLTNTNKHSESEGRRLTNLIERGTKKFVGNELTFFTEALNQIWLRDATREDIHRLIKRAREDASRGMDAKTYARLLGLHTEKGSQSALQGFVGEHFLLRRTFSNPTLVVSYMKIDQDADAAFPAQFSTQSWTADGPDESAERVEGIYYSPEEENGRVIFSIGRYLSSTQVRNAIFEPVKKPTETSNDELPSDLKGLRLGLSVPSREARGYRIWSSRLIASAPSQGWDHFARSYPIEKGVPPRLKSDSAQQWFEDHIIGFRHIMAWLNMPSARLD